MSRYRFVLWGIAVLAAHFSVAVAANFDFDSLQSDAEADEWLRKSSSTYATIVQDIAARKELRGYRFATKDDIPRGMVTWVDGYLEIQLSGHTAHYYRHFHLRKSAQVPPE